MSGSRVIRGTRAKIFLYVCIVVIITGLLACYNNSLSQIDDLKKSNALCHLQEENLSTQVQVITDYKIRLEKNLKSEKDEHKKTQQNLESSFREEKEKYQKENKEAKLKFNSLQQHFNLLQTQHDDFKEECSKLQQKQVDDVKELQEKMKQMEEEIKKLEADKEVLKTNLLTAYVKNDDMKQQLGNNVFNKADSESKYNHLLFENEVLQRDLNKIKETCSETRVQEAALPINPESSSRGNIAPKPQKSYLQQPPSPSDLKGSSKSSTKTGLKASTSSVNRVKPIGVPTIPTANQIKELKPENTGDEPKIQKLPEGVVAAPLNEEPNQNELPLPAEKSEVKKVEIKPKLINNNAQEDNDGLEFNDIKNNKQEAIFNQEPKKDDADKVEYDAPMNNDPDDDDADANYPADFMARQKDTAVRN